MQRGFLLTMIVLATGVAALWPTVLSLVGYWEDTDNLSYTHGYLIAAISAWLVWRSRARLNTITLHPSWLAVGATAVLGGVWYLALISGIEVGHQVLLPAILLAAVAGGLGLRAAAVVAFPVGFLYFAVPVWSLINGQLQALTTLGVSFMIRATGLPAYIEGNFVHIPSGTFEIAGGCSGLHFFIVALAIAALYGELDRDRLRNRLLLVALAALMAIVMNWIRVYTIILNGHLTDMQGFLVQVDHYYFGWALFAVLLVLFFWIARRFVPLAVEASAAAMPATALPAPGVSVAGVIATLVVLAVGPGLNALANARAAASDVPTALEMPAGVGGWQGPDWSGGTWRPSYPKADAEAQAEYRLGDQWVSAYANVYASQSQQRELVGSVNNILGATGWQRVEKVLRPMDTTEGAAEYVEITAAAPGDARWIVGYLYVVGDRTLTGDITSKLYYGVAVLAGRPQSGVVAAAARCADDGCDAASAAVHEFLSTHAEAVAATLRKGP